VGRKALSRKPEPKRRKTWPRWTGFRGMTLRDWLPIVGALLIPVMIALGTWGITWQQGKIEDQRAEAERKLAEQHSDDTALQAYLSKMNNLLVEEHLRTTKYGDELRTLARAQTLSAFATLDASHKRTLFLFLYEAHLINLPTSEEWSSGEIKNPIVFLAGANLRDIDLSLTDLSNTGSFTAAVPDPKGNLSFMDCEEHCIGIELSGTDLSHADLRGSLLVGSGFAQASLYHAKLQNATLTSASFRKANLRSANLSGAKINAAALNGADLSKANLSGVRRWTKEQLAEAKSLKGATMPDGQVLKSDDNPKGPTFEEWLKDKDRKEDG
jgi:uncharacterized protein YjbI with pentapeptide repeats